MEPRFVKLVVNGQHLTSRRTFATARSRSTGPLPPLLMCPNKPGAAKLATKLAKCGLPRGKLVSSCGHLSSQTMQKWLRRLARIRPVRTMQKKKQSSVFASHTTCPYKRMEQMRSRGWRQRITPSRTGRGVGGCPDIKTPGNSLSC